MEEKNNTYYTPEKEEFCFGFEYEMRLPCIFDYSPRADNGDGYTKKFHKLIFPKQYNSDDVSMYYDKKKEIYRVKYLDRKDIESLGWNPSSNPDYIRYVFNGLHSDFPQIVLEYEYKQNRIIIFNLKQEGTNRYVIFDGVIKNKSELKKIMQQLRII